MSEPFKAQRVPHSSKFVDWNGVGRRIVDAAQQAASLHVSIPAWIQEAERALKAHSCVSSNANSDLGKGA